MLLHTKPLRGLASEGAQRKAEDEEGDLRDIHDPIATELKAPRPTLHDDSIMLIKGNTITPLFPVSASLVDDIHDLVCASPPITEMKAAQEVTMEPAQGNAAKDTQSVIRQEKECIIGEAVTTDIDITEKSEQPRFSNTQNRLVQADLSPFIPPIASETEVEAGTEMDADHTP
jgi:hypothetical protein